MEECGVAVDHATVQRWVVKDSPLLAEAFHRRKQPGWVSWRMDETYVRVKGEWRYLYRAVDKHGQTIDFLLTEPFLSPLCPHGVHLFASSPWSIDTECCMEAMVITICYGM
jgi:hypothetical protein